MKSHRENKVTLLLAIQVVCLALLFSISVSFLKGIDEPDPDAETSTPATNPENSVHHESPPRKPPNHADSLQHGIKQGENVLVSPDDDQSNLPDDTVVHGATDVISRLDADSLTRNLWRLDSRVDPERIRKTGRVFSAAVSYNEEFLFLLPGIALSDCHITGCDNSLRVTLSVIPTMADSTPVDEMDCAECHHVTDSESGRRCIARALHLLGQSNFEAFIDVMRGVLNNNSPRDIQCLAAYYFSIAYALRGIDHVAVVYMRTAISLTTDLYVQVTWVYQLQGVIDSTIPLT